MKSLLQKTYMKILLIVLGLLIVVGGCFLLRLALDPYDNRMVENVSIGGLDVGGMTRREAREALKSAAEESLLSQPLSVELPEDTLSLSPVDAGLELNIRKAVNAAFKVGRTEETNADTVCDVGLLTYLTLDEAYIRGLLEAYAAQHNTDLTQSEYRLEGDMPALSTENGTAAPCQTLQITLGLPTAHLNVEDAYGSILSEYDKAIGEWQSETYGLNLEVPAAAVPEAPDLEAIYEELYIAPVNDSLDMEAYVPVAGSYGYRFDLEAAQKAVSAAEYGETVSIPMAYEEPEIIGEGVYFRDVLGSCETKHNTNENRNTNLRLLCAALDGVILQPGEEFSYNETVGERTAERGYKPAPAYSGTRLTDSIGGGVCQGSTTLYNCVLLADLEVVHRLCHGATVTYVPLGLDATVNWGTTDFKFRNNFHFPIKLQAEVADGYVKMKILGTDEKDYYIKMESRWSDDDVAIYAVSYKCKYDKETDELISRDREAFSTYYKNIG